MENMQWETFGHENIKKILSLQMAENHMAHAYLFWGQQGLGKQTLAMEMAGKILSTSKPFSHPDFVFLQADEDGKIEIESVRQFMEKLSLKPFVSKTKVAILDGAHLLSSQSANALLKTIEEPSGDTVIFLISSSGQMLPTVFSRCQSFYFNSFSDKQIAEFAHSKKIPVSEELLKFSFGRPGILMTLFSNQKKLAKLKEILEQLENLKSLDLAQRLLKISEYSDLETFELQNIFQTWLNFQTQELKKNIEEYKIVQKLSIALSGLKQNLNKKLILQNLFLNI